jgi:hypothetical protein
MLHRHRRPCEVNETKGFMYVLHTRHRVMTVDSITGIGSLPYGYTSSPNGSFDFESNAIVVGTFVSVDRMIFELQLRLR